MNFHQKNKKQMLFVSNLGLKLKREILVCRVHNIRTKKKFDLRINSSESRPRSETAVRTASVAQKIRNGTLAELVNSELITRQPIIMDDTHQAGSTKAFRNLWFRTHARQF